MLVYAALGCAVITFLMCFLHILLILGMPIGEYVLGGNNRVIPLKKRYINVIFACIFLLLGVCYIGKASLLSFQIPEVLLKIIMIIYTVFLAYAIIGNIFFTYSQKEKIVMIPASILGFICSVLTLICD